MYNYLIIGNSFAPREKRVGGRRCALSRRPKVEREINGGGQPLCLLLALARHRNFIFQLAYGLHFSRLPFLRSLIRASVDRKPCRPRLLQAQQQQQLLLVMPLHQPLQKLPPLPVHGRNTKTQMVVPIGLTASPSKVSGKSPMTCVRRLKKPCPRPLGNNTRVKDVLITCIV